MPPQGTVSMNDATFDLVIRNALVATASDLSE